MSEIPLNSIFTIVGIVIGFTLSQVADLIKNNSHKSQNKKAVTNELLIIKDSLSNAEKQQGIFHVSRKNFPFVTDAYDCLKVQLASSLKPQNLASVNKAYVRIKELNIDGAQGARGFITHDSVIYQHNLDEVIAIIKEAIKALS